MVAQGFEEYIYIDFRFFQAFFRRFRPYREIFRRLVSLKSVYTRRDRDFLSSLKRILDISSYKSRNS